jgi:hypothetical protein
MTDISVTAGNVVAGANAKKLPGTAGAAITAGQVLYRAAATGKLLPVDVDSGTAEVRVPVGIALNGASDGQPIDFVYEGDVNVGGTLVVGTIYVASDTAGGIMPAADLEAGDYVSVLGVASAANNLKMKLIVSGAAVPA